MSREKLMGVLRAPHMSEKSTALAERQKEFVFKVATDAGKADIKAAVELMFNVKVDVVRVMNVKGKKKGRAGGCRPDWKKAYVALQAGHDIDFMRTE